MVNTSSKKTKTSARVKIAGVFGIMVLAVAFFAFPFNALAHSQGNDLTIPGLGTIPINIPQLCGNGCQDCGNGCQDCGNGCQDCGNECLPFDIQDFVQQLHNFLNKQIQKLLNDICGDNNNCNCDNNGNCSSNGLKETIQQSPVPFKLIGVFEQSGKPLGSKVPSPPTQVNAPITIVKVKFLQRLQTGYIIAGKDAKGNIFTGRIISPNTSPVKKAIGLINGRGTPQIVTLAL